ncbi:MAG TPA: zinc-binding dehydrogenase, partial [Thermoleophilaceae bacterium]|jgi:alcohol dehydrogenase
VSPEAAASVSDNLADAWRTVGPQLEARPGAEVLIASATPSLGLYAAAIALALGAGRVVYCDRDAARLARAGELGCEVVEGYPKRLGPFPVTVDASGDRDALHLALRSTEPEGFCTVASIFYEPETPFPMLEMYTAGITVHTGRVHARPVAPKLLDLMAAGRLRPERVAGTVVPWDQAPEALADRREKLVISRA